MKKLCERLISLKNSSLLMLGIWCFTRLFRFIDVFSPPDGTGDPLVEGITFSNNREYINYINKFEKTKNRKGK